MYATGSPAAQQLNLLGRLLREAAEVLDAQGDQETATRARFQALDAHLAVLEVDDPRSAEAAAALDGLVAALREYEFSGGLKRRLWTVQAARGEYASAEDWLFEALDASPADSDLLRDAIAIYEGMSALDDATLRAGGVSSDETRLTLDELRGRLAMIERAGPA